MISGVQIRSARALLGLSGSQLAELADVGWATIQRYEDVEGVPPSRNGTLERVIEALHRQGIEFIGDPVTSPGVRLTRKPG